MPLIPTTYRPRTIRGIIIALMNEFRGLKVENFTRPTVSGETPIVKTVDVPLGFGHMSKFHQIIKKGQAETQTYQSLPKMALSWDSINFDGNRARGFQTFRKFYNRELELSDADSFFTNLNPKPWNLGFTLDIRTESLNHFTQLMENILPYFDPARNLRVKEFSFLNIERDLKVKLEGVTQDFLREVQEDGVSYVRGQIQLSVEAFLMVPELSNASVIKSIHTRYLPIESFSNADISAFSGMSTSGWASSAAFPNTFNTSAFTSSYSNSADIPFEIYFKDFDDC